jgi:DNA-binding transcriptional ArsR family regulator
MDEAFRAVADPTRRAILRLVRERELPAGEIAGHFPSMSRPAVSQHLRVLTDARLVEVRPDGNRRLYRWRPEGLRDAATFLEEMWADRLADLKAAAEREEWPERTRAARGGRPSRIEADRRGRLGPWSPRAQPNDDEESQ